MLVGWSAAWAGGAGQNNTYAPLNHNISNQIVVDYVIFCHIVVVCYSAKASSFSTASCASTMAALCPSAHRTPRNYSTNMDLSPDINKHLNHKIRHTCKLYVGQATLQHYGVIFK